MPDTHFVYGDNGLTDYSLCDTRYMAHGQRFIASHNAINPKIYKITKVKDLEPQGVIHLTLKQDELDEKRDNIDLMVCNYYDDSGETQIVINEVSPPDLALSSYIYPAHVNANGELEIDYVQIEERDTIYNKLNIGHTYYFVSEYYIGEIGGEQTVDPTRLSEWKIEVADTTGLTDAQIKHLDGLMVMENIDNNTISINPKKSRELIGRAFILTAMDMTGESRSTMRLEVIG